MRVGVLGGSFDPIHMAHIALAEKALSSGNLDKVLFMPTHIQPFKQEQESSPDDERLCMLRLALAGSSEFGITDVEIRRGGVSYTIDSLRLLKQELGGAELVFIMGTDMFLMVEKWWKADELLREFELCVGVREGYKQDEVAALAEKLIKTKGAKITLMDGPHIELSASEIREKLKAGESIKGLVPEAVRLFLYVRAHEKKERFEHTKRVAALAVHFAKKFGADREKAALAALIHDVCKESAGGQENNLEHGALAAKLAQDEFGIADEDVLNAIRYHTTGRAGMSLLEQIVYAADTVEPGRTYEGVGRLLELCEQDITSGTLAILIELREYLLKKGYNVARETDEAIEDLTKRTKICGGGQ